MSEGAVARFGRRVLDPRVLIGLGITGVALWFSLRDVDWAELGSAMASANLALILGLSVPASLAMVYFRALRWRHLTDAVVPISRGALFRGVAVGFMANNLFPLRMGEFVRAWYLSRESGASSAAIFGTVIVERMIDAAVVLGMASVILGMGGARAVGIDASAVILPLLVVALVPVLFVAALRVAPEAIIGLVTRVAGLVLPERYQAALGGLLGQLAEGLGSLRGGTHLFWVAIHSVIIWLVLSVIPFWAALVGFGVPLEGPTLLAASYSMITWVGAAVALPSAPGFFGPYHAACWVALAPFGVSKSVAIAIGTVCHAIFWVSLTALGLLVLRSRHTSLHEIDEATADSR